MLSTEKINKILGILTILFTLWISTTVTGTFYGMNIELPEGIDKIDSSHFFGPTNIISILINNSLIATSQKFDLLK
jgi:magnesium transporter